MADATVTLKLSPAELRLIRAAVSAEADRMREIVKRPSEHLKGGGTPREVQEARETEGQLRLIEERL